MIIDKFKMMEEVAKMKPYDARFIAIGVGEAMEWDKWAQEIPYISFPSTWEVKAIPPTSGAIVRYNIRHKEYPDTWVSIYLDCYDLLGCYGDPYWEVYPHDDDVIRCDMNDTEQLLKNISYSLRQQIKEAKSK